MEMTQLEAKMLNRMRKQQSQWRWGRWVQLGYGLGIAIASSCLFVRLTDFLKEGSVSGLACFTLINPMVFLWFLVGVSMVVRAIVEWRGNPERDLILKLFNEIDRMRQQNFLPEYRKTAESDDRSSTKKPEKS